jgi:AcrR family transcriptional regulator
MPRLPSTERRGQLLDAARTEFLARGYGAARLQSVARACGVTEALVYKHFESKDELFDAAVVQPLHELLAARIADIQAMPVDPEGAAQLETTRRFMRTLLGTFTDTVRDIGVVLFGETAHARTFYARHIRPLIDAAVAASIATTSRWPRADYDIETAMKAAFGMAFWLALDDALTPGEERSDAELDATADTLADILFKGLKAR